MSDMIIGLGEARLEDDCSQRLAKARSLPQRVLDRLVHAFGRRRQRYALTQLDERLLRDIGISPAQARAESQKRFWQA